MIRATALTAVQKCLRLPVAYRAFQRAVGGNRLRDAYINGIVRPVPGTRILDLGCGPGDILEHLPNIDYVGIDVSKKYIDAARKRFGDRGTFISGSVADLVVEMPESFDIVMANGVLHHLDDDEALALLRLARIAAKPSGRFISIDGCYVMGQSPVARLLLSMDRGRFVRPAEEYLALASSVFPHSRSEIHHGLLRFPFTHIVMMCENEHPPL